MKYELSICAYCKDETDYLEEWVNFNRCVGVEHFYIYDNLSVEPVKKTLKKYIDNGYVTVIDFPGKKRQIECYNYHINNHINNSKWTAFFDCDEFLIPKQCNNVLEILIDYEKYGGLCVNWVQFGSSGFLTKQQGLVTETFTLSKPDTHTKTIVKSDLVLKSSGNSHSFLFKNNYSVSENFIRVDNVHILPSIKKIQLNHYLVKSFEEFEKRVNKTLIGTADGGPPRSINNIYECDRICTEVDNSAFRFIENTKKLYL